ncbi:hypothetical protein FGL95_15920 [Nocardiaceae bacterium YC2-7]|uniref:Uncharacterized protein n=1 Tax=Antrihabitans stalactiti TaxID=2584121 RepID=A0A848KFU5_9NOCA|nr:hypothetical protein [Antrihabitans stalactiti]
MAIKIPVLVKALQRDVLQPRVFRVVDPVLSMGAASVPQFEIGSWPRLVLVTTRSTATRRYR